ncbi:MAG: DUF4292 domain-containing protein [Flavobacteriaceae bacterium]
MRFLKYLLIISLVFGACKTKKSLVETGTIKKLSAKKIIKNHTTTFFDAKTLDTRLLVDYSDNRGGKRTRHSFKVRYRMQKDSVIWLKGSKVLTVFKAKITPNSFSYYSPLNKTYFQGDYSFLEKMLGTKITFDQLQNLLLGQSILDLNDQKYSASISSGKYKLSPKRQKELYSIFFLLDPRNFRMNRQILQVDGGQKTLNIQYDGYIAMEDQLVPKRITINATEGERYTFMNVRFKALKLNKKISIPYRVPSGYKRIEL